MKQHPEFFFTFRGRGREGEPAFSAVVAKKLHSCLYGNRIHFHEKRIHQVKKLPLKLRGKFEVSGKGSIRHSFHGQRSYVGANGYDARASKSHSRNGHIIVSAPNYKIVGTKGTYFEYFPDIGRRLFNTGNVSVLRKLMVYTYRDIDACSGRYIVNDQRNCYCVGNYPVVGYKSLLCGFIVVGRYDQKSIGPRCLSGPAQGNRVSCIVGARSRDDDALFFDVCFSFGENSELLFVC